MTTTPTVKVEIAFEYSPVATSPTWTDVSAYVRDGSIQRGRGGESEAFSAGNARIRLDNRDRRFDPTNTSSPYAGYLSPRNQMRISATWAGVTYPLFRGFVVGWPQDRSTSDRDASTEISAVDGLAYLSGQILGADLYSSYLNTYSPIAIWPLGDEGVTQVDIVGGQNFTTTSELAHNDTTCAAYLTGNPTSFTTVDYGIGPSVVVPNAPFTLIAWGRTNLTGRGILEGTAGNRLFVDGFGLAHYLTPAGASVTSSASIADGTSKMIVVTHDPSQTAVGPKMYVNGVDVSLGSTGGGSASGSMIWQVLGGGTPASGNGAWEGPLQQVAILGKAISAAETFALYNVAVNGETGVNLDGSVISSAQQVGDLLTVAGWPAYGAAVDTFGTTWRAITTGPYSAPDYIETANTNALDALGKIVASEQGQLFVNAKGDVVFLGAWDLWTGSYGTSQATFSDAGTAGTVPYVDSGFDLDDAYLANDIEVKTSKDQSARSRNTTSIARYGRRSLSIATRLRQVGDAQVIADYRLARYAYPIPRLREFSVLPLRSPATAFPKILGLDLQYRITVRSQPLKTGSAFSQDFWIERITHDFAPQQWATRIGATQVPSNVWTLDTSHPFDGTSTRLG